MNIELLDFKNDKYSVNVSHFKLEKSKGIVVVFPGAGYSHMGPCLYYPSNAFYESGYELLNIEYDFRKERLKDNSQESYRDYFTFLLDNIRALNLQGSMIALCKSIGTRIVGSKDSGFFEKVIWSTPALKDDFVVKSISNKKEKSFVIIGTSDPFYSKDVIAELERDAVRTLIVDSADHGLDIDNNIDRSLDEMKVIVSRSLEFINNG